MCNGRGTDEGFTCSRCKGSGHIEVYVKEDEVKPDIKMEQSSHDKGYKWNKGKLKYSLILVGFLRLMADILTKGEANHPRVDGAPSWQRVPRVEYEDAMMRHIEAYRYDNNSLDKEMNTHHLGHVAVNAMFLWWFSASEQFGSGIVSPPTVGLDKCCEEEHE